MNIISIYKVAVTTVIILVAILSSLVSSKADHETSKVALWMMLLYLAAAVGMWI